MKAQYFCIAGSGSTHVVYARVQLNDDAAVAVCQRDEITVVVAVIALTQASCGDRQRGSGCGQSCIRSWIEGDAFEARVRPQIPLCDLEIRAGAVIDLDGEVRTPGSEFHFAGGPLVWGIGLVADDLVRVVARHLYADR